MKNKDIERCMSELNDILHQISKAIVYNDIAQIELLLEKRCKKREEFDVLVKIHKQNIIEIEIDIAHNPIYIDENIPSEFFFDFDTEFNKFTQ
jgi:hypothetical protein